MSAVEFTMGAETALRLAQESAAELGHSYVGTEHLLLGVAREGRGPGAKALASAGLTAELPVSYTHLTLPTICSV